ncbi:MAG TPA: histidine phosphatase family protein [Rhabdochlamydiaceae bacterium]|jgi:probable phosphoglycerate mutase
MKKLYLIRHGETEWTLSGQHTGTTDIALTKNGQQQAQLLADRLQGHDFSAVFVSPLQRAYKTCEIAGLCERAVVERDLSEWNYGHYEGKTSKQIHETHPHWNIFLNGAPGGESVKDIEKRCAKMCHLFQEASGDVAVFSHGHFLRALALSCIQLPIAAGRHFTLFPAAVSILAQEKNVLAISLWNDISHLMKR